VSVYIDVFFVRGGLCCCFRFPKFVGDGGFLPYTGYEACGVLDTRNVVWCGVGRVVVGGSCLDVERMHRSGQLEEGKCAGSCSSLCR
jgi:hypothetical protein